MESESRGDLSSKLPLHSTDFSLGPWNCPKCKLAYSELPGDARCTVCQGQVVKSPTANPESTRLLRTPSGRVAEWVTGSLTAADDLVGADLDVYEIRSLLGKGAMGRVYLARHKDLQRHCALKVLSKDHIRGDEDFISRFFNEGRAAAALTHPNIVTIHAIGSVEGHHFLEMEFVAGESLQQYIQRNGRMEPAKATLLMVRIADGLAAAHRSGIVHRDLKPDNVLLTPRQLPKIADFGLAHHLHLEQPPEWENRLYGTPKFMAPELFRGETATAASDVYALGIIYFFILTGRFPFEGENLNQLMHTILHASLPNVREWCPELPLEMAECLSLLCSKSPQNRPQDGVAASLLLNSVLGESRDLEGLLREAFDDWSIASVTGEGVRYNVQILLPRGRKQEVRVELLKQGGSERLVQIYSVCCPAQQNQFEYVLRLNAEIPHGGLAIKEIAGLPMFVMMDTYPWATVDPEEIRRSALSVASRADGLEMRLTGRDHF